MRMMPYLNLRTKVRFGSFLTRSLIHDDEYRIEVNFVEQLDLVFTMLVSSIFLVSVMTCKLVILLFCIKSVREQLWDHLIRPA